MRQPAVFLDRDGTLVEDVGYLSDLNDLRLFPSAADAVRLLKNSGFLIIVVTNQSGIGRGIYGEDAMHAINSEIQRNVGGAIDAFYFCPHLPDAGCRCRKPGLGMIEAASADFPIDLQSSWMIGDKSIDIETGKEMGARTALVLTGYGRQHEATLIRSPELISEHVGAAAEEIVKITRAT
jgi:histidinol-phosphate phosphatase family protein